MNMTPIPRIAAGLALVLLGGCSDATGPAEDRIVEGVNLDALFADPSPSEVASVEADWAGRDPSAASVVTELDETVTAGGTSLRLRVVSHEVDGNRHYGAIVVPMDLQGTAPVIIYSHGGDGGVDVDEALLIFSVAGDLADESVWVIPSFRSESLQFDGQSWTSEGDPSPWDRDVDDGLALLDVALAVEPGADPNDIAILGVSRGAGVGLLMGIRDARIDRIVEFFGPTDFFDVFVQDVVEEALLGAPRNLPGLAYLNETLIQPLRRGEVTTAQARLELIRRSAVVYASRLPRLQLHHGTADAVVEVSQAESMIRTMEALGRFAPDFEGFLYEGGGHNPLTMPGSLDRALEFLFPGGAPSG
ncbi:MAG: peptidase [Gemmatimonadetes bacterium]|nr:peptidase [Gemmatimonadota bacterium]